MHMENIGKEFVVYIQIFIEWATRWADPNLFWLLGATLFISTLFGMSPLRSKPETDFLGHVLIKTRVIICFSWVYIVAFPVVTYLLYISSFRNYDSEAAYSFLVYYKTIAMSNWLWPVVGFFSGSILNLLFNRYVVPVMSRLKRKMRFQQTDETLSDIREEKLRFKSKQFLPSDHYSKDALVVGIDEENQPIYVPNKVWYETNMQVIGPTRYGKGVVLCGLIDQAIRRGETVFYIDPKDDVYAPHIMYKACQDTGRKFIYLSLQDDEIGSYAPFAGGEIRNARDRLMTAFDLELTGNSGTDYYKTQEQAEVDRYFTETRTIKGLASKIDEEKASKLFAMLSSWLHHKSLCPKTGKGFSVADALMDGAVVYIKGSLSNEVIKKATKLLIIEIVQEAMRLKHKRKTHMSFFVDEVRFLASKQLADAMATVIGARVNMVLAYQSIGDTMTPDDKTLDGRSLTQSINVNSQVKVIYGGADSETAKWGSELSGERQKTVSRMEKTEVQRGGGEVWDKARMVGIQGEWLIPANVFLSLPPLVCAIFRPQEEAKICFTSFVPVESNDPLNEYLESKAKPKPKPKAITINDTDTESQVDEDNDETSEGEENKSANISSLFPKPKSKPSNKQKGPPKNRPNSAPSIADLVHADFELDSQIDDFASEVFDDDNSFL